jgi:uncharacterized membrane protein
MLELGIARVLHVLGVVVWIGGLAMVTTVILPAARRLGDPNERVALFESIEGRFAWQARAATVVVGLSGVYLLERLEAWSRFSSASFWWLHAMVAVWAVFTLVLFVLEPLVLRRWFLAQAACRPARAFRWLHRAHWVLLTVSLITVAGAVAGSHGWRWL